MNFIRKILLQIGVNHNSVFITMYVNLVYITKNVLLSWKFQIYLGNKTIKVMSMKEVTMK